MPASGTDFMSLALKLALKNTGTQPHTGPDSIRTSEVGRQAPVHLKAL